MNWLFIAVSFFVVVVFLFAAAVSLFLLQGRSTEKVLLHHMQQAGAWEDFSIIMKCFRTTCEACTQQCAWLLKQLVFAEVGDLTSWHKTMNCYRATIVCLDAKVLWKLGQFHFSWVYTFSAMLSSLRNWANHDRYRLRPNTPAQLCWTSSRLHPHQKNKLIKFAIIKPSTSNHDKNLWNWRGAPDEITCLTGFFRCPSAIALICMKLFNVCANELSLSLLTVRL